MKKNTYTNVAEKFFKTIDKYKWLIVGTFTIVGFFVDRKTKKLENNTAKIERELIKSRIYDNAVGHYWELKRSLSNDEYAKIDNRVSAGEKLSDVLKDMKILK